MTVLHGWFGRSQGEEAPKESRGAFALLLSLGPISLFATLSAAFLKNGNLDLAIAAAAGIFLSFSFRGRGFCYSLLLLFLSAAFKHLFFLDAHFWQMGIEISMALGFGICALSAVELHARKETAEARIESQASALFNLEEEASRRVQEALEEKIALQNRLSDFQKELDDAQSELSTLRILNDVVRKSSLRQEEEDARDAEKERRIAELLQEIEELHRKEIPYEKAELLQALNAARVEREQTSLINETLVRMHATADRKAKELLVQNEQLQEQVEALLQTQGQQEETKLQLAHLQKEQIAMESEKLQWKQQLAEKDHMIALFQERICALSEAQALYFQLKKQFEEKNTVLHQTRQELFRTETALQAAQIEQKWEEVEFPFFESILAKEVVLLESENLSLENENAELAEIIGMLSKAPKATTPSRKKKKLSEGSTFWETSIIDRNATDSHR